jgi:hypothetical protein
MELENPLQDAPVGDLMKAALDDVRELVRLEVELSMREARDDLRSLEHAAVGFGIAAGAALVSLSLFAVALVLALGAKAYVAAVIGGVLLALALASAAIAYGALPKNPMERSRARLATDVRQIKENLA